MTSEWVEKQKKRIEAVNEKIETYKSHVETASQVAVAAEAGIRSYGAAQTAVEMERTALESERADVEAAKSGVERAVDYLEGELAPVKQQYEEMKALEALGPLARQYSVELKFTDTSEIEDYDGEASRAIEVSGERSEEFLEHPDVLNVDYEIFDVEEEEESAEEEMEEEKEEITEDEPKEKEPYGSVSNRKITSLLAAADESERAGLNVSDARRYATKALNSEGEERAKYFTEAETALRVAHTGEIKYEDEDHAETKEETSFEEVEDESDDSYLYEPNDDDFEFDVEDEEESRFEGTEEDIGTFFKQSGYHFALAKVYDAVAQESGLEVEIDTDDPHETYVTAHYNSGEKKEEKSAKALEESFEENTSGTWRFEIEEREYNLLMNTDDDNAAGNLLRALEDSGMVTPPSFMWTGYRIEPIPKGAAEYLMKEAGKLRKTAEGSGIFGAPARNSKRISRAFDDEASANLYASIVADAVKEEEVEKTVKPIGDGRYRATIVFDTILTDDDSVKEIDARFDDGEKRTIKLTKNVYDSFMKRPVGDPLGDFVKNETREGRVKKAWFSDSQKITVPHGASTGFTLQIEALKNNVPTGDYIENDFKEIPDDEDEDTGRLPGDSEE